MSRGKIAEKHVVFCYWRKTMKTFIKHTLMHNEKPTFSLCNRWLSFFLLVSSLWLSPLIVALSVTEPLSWDHFPPTSWAQMLVAVPAGCPVTTLPLPLLPTLNSLVETQMLGHGEAGKKRSDHLLALSTPFFPCFGPVSESGCSLL